MHVVGGLAQDEKLRMVTVILWAAFFSAIVTLFSVLSSPSDHARAIWVAVGVASSLLFIRRAAVWRLEVGSSLLCLLLFGVVTVGVSLSGGIGSPVTAGFIVVVLLAFLLLGRWAACYSPSRASSPEA